jgi:hypothetical protein
VASVAAQAQTTPPPQADAPPAGEVLFQSHGTPPPTPEDSTAPALAAITPAIPDAARSAILFTAYDLDAHITPATASLLMRARLTLRNISAGPLPHIALQISSSLKWENITLNGQQLPLAQQPLDTDADHTGKVSEAILTLPQPLAPGASITLDTLYSGTIPQDATRLERIGATAAQALDTDWDAIGDTALTSSSDSSSSDSPSTDNPITLNTALRGFGNVLWYPVSSPPLFLGDGAKLFQAVAAIKAAGSTATIRLRLAVGYHGDPPTAAYFCGRRQPFTALPDDPDAPTSTGAGIATAAFPPSPIGFRVPSLFLIERPETLLAPVPEPESTSADNAASSPSSPTGVSSQPEAAPSAALADRLAASPDAPSLLAVETTDDAPLPSLALTAQTIAPLLQKWFGPQPLSALTILDHTGQPFEDGPLLVAPLTSLAAETSAPALVHSLTHAWVQTGQPWFDEGLAQFMSLLWTEQQQGRTAAIAQLTDLMQPVALAEPTILPPPNTPNPTNLSSRPESAQSHRDDAAERPASSSATTAGEPLITSASDLFYRRKAAAVWWMLRAITGDQPLAAAFTDWRVQPVSHATPLAQATAFEHLLEKSSNQNLDWFFNDWVFRDRGLPDLTIAAVEPRQLPAGAGHDSGWLVAVTIRNEGAAVAEVPVVIRSGTFSTTKRLRIAGFSTTTDRVLVEAQPTEVLVNDGTTPELRTSTHTQAIVLKTQ